MHVIAGALSNVISDAGKRGCSAPIALNAAPGACSLLWSAFLSVEAERLIIQLQQATLGIGNKWQHPTKQLVQERGATPELGIAVVVRVYMYCRMDRLLLSSKQRRLYPCSNVAAGYSRNQSKQQAQQEVPAAAVAARTRKAA